MRVRPILTLLALAVLPTLAQAQRGGGGHGAGRDDKYKPTNDLPKYPPATDLQKLNPVALLIDQRKKMPLDDSTVANLRVLQSKLYERNGDLIARYDSVQRLYKNENANDASSLKADTVRRLALTQVGIMNAVMDSLMSRRQNDDMDALAVIADEKQKKKAADLLDKQDADFAKLMPAGATPRQTRRRP